ncbi:hypothetical protein LLG96_02965 [bacterium]|nr:hypothetical protein [bacterium]
MKFTRLMNHMKCRSILAILAVTFGIVSLAGAEEALFLKGTFTGGFKLKDTVAFYNPGNLYEYIDGQAVFYLSYGFKRLEHAYYTKDTMEYTVDVYELASRLSAFGSYRQQRDADAELFKVGCEGSAISYLTVFYKDRYYVEIIPTSSESEKADVMKELALQVAAVIPGETDIPPEVGLFPKENLVAMSERYVDENLLSYTVMGRGLTAVYDQGSEGELRVFLALPADNAAAKNVYDGFLDKIKSSSLSKLENVEGVKGETPYRGTAIMYLRDRFVFGCLGVKNEQFAIKVLGGLYGNLKKTYRIE